MKVLLPLSVVLLLMTHLSTPSFLQPSKKEYGHEIGLMDLMKQPLFQEAEMFHHATSIVSSLEAAPSCHRLAARNLIESCQSLQDPKETESELVLDQIKTVFAARLAVCELAGAHASVPQECHPMVATPVAGSHGFGCLLGVKKCSTGQNAKEKARSAFPIVSSNELRQCLNALESRPQWWTSYSNARQNAVVVCHATRSQIEKDEIIETHQTLMEASKGAAEGLATATKRSKEAIKAQESFLKKIESFQLQLLKELDTQTHSLHKLARRVETDLGGVFVRFSKVVDETASKVLGVNTQIDKAAQDAAKLQVVLTDSASELMIKALALSQIIERNQGTALTMQGSMTEMQDKDVDPIRRTLQDTQAALQFQAQMMEQFVASQIATSKRMDHLDNTVARLEHRALTMDNSLEVHAEALTGLMRTLTTHMEENNNLAVALKADLDDARTNLISAVRAFFYVFNLSSVVFLVLGFVIVVLAYLVFGSSAAQFILGTELTAYVVKVTLEYALVHSNAPAISASMKGVIVITISVLLISISSVVRTFRDRRENNYNLVRKMGWFSRSSP